MFQTIRNAWKIPDLRKKILYTVALLVIFRFGAFIPVPGLDPAAMQSIIGGGNTLFGFLDTLTGGAFGNATIFAMGITPYINASIIMQLLTVAIPYFEKLQKEGDEGRKKLAQFTRYGTVVLGFIQSAGLYAGLRTAITSPGLLSFFTITITFTAGTAFLMWLGEQITEKGIGNGISLIIFTGIVSRGHAMIMVVYNYMDANAFRLTSILLVILFVLLAVLIVAFVVTINSGERRIPVQYAKRVVGRKMYGGQSTHMPIKVAMAGVIPIIFAMSILAFPQTIGALMGKDLNNLTGFWGGILSVFEMNTWSYSVMYFLLIIGFTYFYTAIQFNPIEMANNMKRNGGFVPGIRPGKPTTDFIARILSRITLVGALFLGIIAVMPIAMSTFMGFNIGLGGTSLLIVVSVALETVKQLESQMLMRHYKGFLE